MDREDIRALEKRAGRVNKLLKCKYEFPLSIEHPDNARVASSTLNSISIVSICCLQRPKIMRNILAVEFKHLPLNRWDELLEIKKLIHKEQ